jgi:hypothetical protein
MLKNPNCLLWWVAPIYKELAAATRTVRKVTPKDWISKKLVNNETIRYIRLFNGSECFFHSADREDTLRGSGLHGLVIDEAPILKKNRWEAELKPSLIDYNGWALFIGTPKGKTWFTHSFLRGLDPSQTDYQSWQISSYANSIEQGGFLPKSNIDAIANDMSELLRRQEILAETLKGEGVVFRNINRQIRNDIKPYSSGERVFVGCDIAKTQDYTVLVALRENGEIIGFDRFNKIDWSFQRKRIISFCKQFRSAYMLIDSTGVGDPIYDELKREYSKVQGYKFTNQTKKELIENLSIMMDNKEIWFPGNPATKEFRYDLKPLQSELESFTYDLLPSGLIRYNAPEGLHDDCVIGLALAALEIKKAPKPLGGCVVPSIFGPPY